MAFFQSTFTNKIDKKGRVSVPAPFRAAVSDSGFSGVALYQSLDAPCVEGADIPFLHQLATHLHKDYGPFNPEQNAIATALIGGSSQLTFDPEGRIMLPAELRESAGITNQATFVGIGLKFQIWNPTVYEEYRIELVRKARETAPKLPPFSGGAV